MMEDGRCITTAQEEPVKDLKKDLRPISLTPSVSKVAEGFVVEDYVKPAILKVIDPNQYGKSRIHLLLSR